MSRVAIIDHGLGNLQAVEKAISKAAGGSPVFRCFDPDALRRADVIVLPGTGKLATCVEELRRIGMAELLPELVRHKPVLAINVGLHALGRQGLGLFEFDTRPLNEDGKLDVRLPHMGWNRVHRVHAHPVWEGVPQDGWFYFAHHARAVADEAMTGATTQHAERFPAMLAAENFIGVQFHPEISHDNGLRLLANFVNWDGHVPG